jgi:hypothetical protein
MNTRLPLEKNDLLQLLNWELSAYEECEGCHFTAITADDSGRSWNARLEGGAVPGQMIARQVIAETRRAFNIAR